MTKNKYDFIRELLEDKKIKPHQRERILVLASREIKYEGTMEERIQKIEEIIFKQNKITITQSEESPKAEDSMLTKYIDPYYLYEFLFEYNQNPILRSTCHDIDTEEVNKINEYCNANNYNLNEHLKKIIEQFDKHENKFYGGGKVNALIRAYLTGKDYKGNKKKDGWTSDRIQINWSSPKLMSWTKKHPNIPPNFNEKLSEDQETELFLIEPQIISPITNEPIQNFTQLVLHFKNLFHLKSGKQSLKAILNRVNLAKKWIQQVDFEINASYFSNNLEHFTDVDKLIQAYNKMIQMIIEQHTKDGKPKVKLSFKEENDSVYVSIHHLNAQYNKTLKSTILRPYGRDYRNLIDFQINGLCNLYLRADFGDKKYAHINLWDGQKLEVTELDKFQGVEHILRFPKKLRSHDIFN